MAEKQPVDLILLTGFLGAGKTTLLNNLLDIFGGRETGVLVNDFGPVSVDGGRVLSRGDGDGPELYEVKDGSIFCSCKSADFVLGLRLFARLRPRRLIVEASGLADPRSMGKLLADNGLTDVFNVTLSLCVVDPKKTYKLSAALPAIGEQVRAADIVLINKEDLAGVDELDRSRELVRSLNPGADVVTTRFSRIDPSLIRRKAGVGGTSGPLEECTLPGQGPEAILLENSRVTRTSLAGFLQRWAHELLRAKGWYAFGEEWWYISDNAGGFEWTQSVPPAGQQPGIVVICRTGTADKIGRSWRELTVREDT